MNACAAFWAGGPDVRAEPHPLALAGAFMAAGPRLAPLGQSMAALEQQLLAKHAELARCDQAHAGAIVEHEEPVNGQPYGD